MHDREKVIKGLNYCTHTDGAECPNCPYWKDDDCVEALNADVLALLKEQNNCENCAIAIEDRQPVVRCKDCKHQNEYRTGSCPFYTTWGSVAPDDWYCADGEKR